MKLRAHGFTLLELLVVIAITAILITLAVPSMRDMINRTSSDDALSRLASDLQFARAKAIGNARAVIVCASANAESATPSCGGGNDWTSGWLVFVDANANSTFESGDELLRAEGPARGGLSVKGTVPLVRYQRDGTLVQSGSFWFIPQGATAPEPLTNCAANGSNHDVGCVTVNRGGRVSRVVQHGK